MKHLAIALLLSAPLALQGSNSNANASASASVPSGNYAVATTASAAADTKAAADIKSQAAGPMLKAYLVIYLIDNDENGLAVALNAGRVDLSARTTYLSYGLEKPTYLGYALSKLREARPEGDDRTLRIMKLLLAHGVSVDKVDNTFTAIAAGAHMLSPEGICILLEHAADPLQRNANGANALHCVYCSPNVVSFAQRTHQVIQILTAVGVDIHGVNPQGFTPVEVQAKSIFRYDRANDVARGLVSFGASPILRSDFAACVQEESPDRSREEAESYVRDLQKKFTQWHALFKEAMRVQLGKLQVALQMTLENYSGYQSLYQKDTDIPAIINDYIGRTLFSEQDPADALVTRAVRARDEAERKKQHAVINQK